jgi:hypothetical protein
VVQYPGFPFGGGQNAAEHAHDRGLPGSVRANQPEDLAPFHTQVQAVDCNQRAEGFAQIFSFNGQHHILFTAERAEDAEKDGIFEYWISWAFGF